MNEESRLEDVRQHESDVLEQRKHHIEKAGDLYRQKWIKIQARLESAAAEEAKQEKKCDICGQPIIGKFYMQLKNCKCIVHRECLKKECKERVVKMHKIADLPTSKCPAQGNTKIHLSDLCSSMSDENPLCLFGELEMIDALTESSPKSEDKIAKVCC